MHKRIVTLGGGTGHYSLLRALKLIPHVDVTAIVNVVDSGGSSGILRDKQGTLPPGDILKAILALSEQPHSYVRNLFLHRFESDEFRGHTIGNLMLSTHASYEEGGMMSAIRAMCAMVSVPASRRVIPVSFAPVHIRAVYCDGSVRKTEDEIDRYRGDAHVVDLQLTPDTAVVCAPAREAIRDADVIVIPPGSLHTSLLPVLKIAGVADLLRQSHAPKVFVCNTMTLSGDTHGFTVKDFIDRIEDSMQCRLDRVLIDNSQHDSELLKTYADQGQYPVSYEGLDDDRLYGAQLVAVNGNLVRHDPTKLADAFRVIVADLCDLPILPHPPDVQQLSGTLSVLS